MKKAKTYFTVIYLVLSVLGSSYSMKVIYRILNNPTYNIQHLLR